VIVADRGYLVPSLGQRVDGESTVCPGRPSRLATVNGLEANAALRRAPPWSERLRSRACAALRASFDEAAEALSEPRVVVDAKSVRHLMLGVGADALRQRDPRPAAALEGREDSEEFAGTRSVVSADGGRLRTREPTPPSEDGKPRLATPWVEPKLVIAYVIDDKERKVRSNERSTTARWATPTPSSTCSSPNCCCAAPRRPARSS